jgi:hypothetical protein
MKGEGPPYAMEMPRQYQSRPSTMPTLLPTIGPYMGGMPSQADAMGYRDGPTSYPYAASKGYYSVGDFPATAYAEESTHEYHGYQPYPSAVVQDPGYMLGPYRGMSSSATMKPAPSAYVESDDGYGYSTGGVPLPAMSHRPTHSGDSSNYSFPGVEDLAASMGSAASRLTPPSSIGRRSLPSQHHLGCAEPLASPYSKKPHSQSPASAGPPTPPTGFGGFEGAGASVSSYPLRSQSDVYSATQSTAGSENGQGSPHRSTTELPYRYGEHGGRLSGSDGMDQSSYMAGGHHGHDERRGSGSFMTASATAADLSRRAPRSILRG